MSATKRVAAVQACAGLNSIVSMPTIPGSLAVLDKRQDEIINRVLPHFIQLYTGAAIFSHNPKRQKSPTCAIRMPKHPLDFDIMAKGKRGGSRTEKRTSEKPDNGG